jgi:hypothetical protein
MEYYLFYEQSSGMCTALSLESPRKIFLYNEEKSIRKWSGKRLLVYADEERGSWSLLREKTKERREVCRANN